ncbi:hypothetical protein AK830_g8924 [Neonectria ditissima]|uniref:Zn(2)-C6 fungal-type domain-containing protein n=1 Tax=Neonectria ditissima TaxID=78410 RepID=A0A0P7BB50_9HYPO|nr:hypothetical protein AK830_g8924 [Neonectria ditissima]
MYDEKPPSKQTSSPLQNWDDCPLSQYFFQDSSLQEEYMEDSPSKRQKLAIFQSSWDEQPSLPSTDLLPMPAPPAATKEPLAIPTSPPAKAKRVRTGCLTCRERHLKCDSNFAAGLQLPALPDCLNCRKRGRECKRGIRLNFLDINVHRLAWIPHPEAWEVQFHDESRDIASEYQGGRSRYAPYDTKPKVPRQSWNGRQSARTEGESMIHSAGAPPFLNGLKNTKMFGPLDAYGFKLRPAADIWEGERNMEILGDHYSHSGTTSEASKIATPSSSSHPNTSHGALPPQHIVAAGNKQLPRRRSSASAAASMIPQATTTTHNENNFQIEIPVDAPLQLFQNESPPIPEREFLTTLDEIGYMQVFVDEVWVWMNCFQTEKHFGRLIPFYALGSTMLLNASLACGVKQLALSSPEKNLKAIHYYNTATSQLLRSLQNPDRNMAECGMTAVVLNVYEIMSEKPAHRMQHIGGARALILECGWDAKSAGIGAACFWQNITMEVLICLSANWQTTWNPDDWGLDLGFFKGRDDEAGLAQDEMFVHRILFIVAKIVDFRATARRHEELNSHEDHSWPGERLGQWQELKRLCDRWNDRCPRTMHPYGYMKASKSVHDSAFPCIWMIKSAATLSRLFYHTAQYILAETHPLEQIRRSEGMQTIRLHHARQVCGIAACTKDRAVVPTAIRCLGVTSSALASYREQVETLGILERIRALAGWHLGSVELELKRAWGWEWRPLPVSLPKSYQENGNHAMPPPQRVPLAKQMGEPTLSATTVTRVLTPPGVANEIVNPLSFADFSLPNHPYQNWYEPPNRTEQDGEDG